MTHNAECHLSDSLAAAGTASGAGAETEIACCPRDDDSCAAALPVFFEAAFLVAGLVAAAAL
jgi:hypothetical protein